MRALVLTVLLAVATVAFTDKPQVNSRPIVGTSAPPTRIDHKPLCVIFYFYIGVEFPSSVADQIWGNFRFAPTLSHVIDVLSSPAIDTTVFIIVFC